MFTDLTNFFLATSDVPMIIEPEDTENLSEWVDECLTHIDDCKPISWI